MTTKPISYPNRAASENMNAEQPADTGSLDAVIFVGLSFVLLLFKISQCSRNTVATGQPQISVITLFVC
jgi:hypothetical protein